MIEEKECDENLELKKARVDLRWHLRFSLLPNCNFRCRYCNPDGLSEGSNALESKEILEIVKAAIVNGIVRVHWTGGEPCLMDMVSLLNSSRKIGMIDQVLTTNGSLQLNNVYSMKEAGLKRVNISLDSLSPKKNKEITGKNFFDNTLQWIKKACEAFDEVTKMNIVPMRDTIREVGNFVDFASQFNGKLMLKFIELCPNNPAFYGNDIQQFYVPRYMIIKELERFGKLKRSNAVGDNPNAEYYQIGNTGVTAILVTMPSQNYKCGLDRCRKMRISPFGIAGSCIQQKGVRLRGFSLKEKVYRINKLKEIRDSYSDIAPVTRFHFRGEFGFWRFGKLEEKEESND